MLAVHGATSFAGSRLIPAADAAVSGFGGEFRVQRRDESIDAFHNDPSTGSIACTAWPSPLTMRRP
jgi:hypothetical protein